MVHLSRELGAVLKVQKETDDMGAHGERAARFPGMQRGVS